MARKRVTAEEAATETVEVIEAEVHQEIEAEAAIATVEVIGAEAEPGIATVEVVEAEAEQIEAEAESEIVDIVDAPYGAKVGSGTRRSAGGQPQPRAQTFLSAVSGGAYLNIYLAAYLIALAQQWEHGCEVKWQRRNGRVDVVRLRAASQKAYTLRTPPQQRPHFVVPTASVSGAQPTREAVPVDSWIENDEICVRVTVLFASGEE